MTQTWTGAEVHGPNSHRCPPVDTLVNEAQIIRNLCHQNHWSQDYGTLVVQEYKRFIILMSLNGLPIIPSDRVYRVWLCHAKLGLDYGGAWFAELLGNPQDYFFCLTQQEPGYFLAANRYPQTLALYEETFGEAPPRSIWPQHLSTYWPNTQWQSPYTTSLSGQISGQTIPGHSPTGPAISGPVARKLDPNEEDGPPPLAIFLAMLIVSLVVTRLVMETSWGAAILGHGTALVQRWRLVIAIAVVVGFGIWHRSLTHPWIYHRKNLSQLKGYEVAYLQSGPDRVIERALEALQSRGDIEVIDSPPLSPELVKRSETWPAWEQGVELLLWHNAGTPQSLTELRHAHRGRLMQSMSPIVARLRQLGLLGDLRQAELLHKVRQSLIFSLGAIALGLWLYWSDYYRILGWDSAAPWLTQDNACFLGVILLLPILEACNYWEVPARTGHGKRWASRLNE
jgi:uncharacterized protein (TIGR04222 family)